MARKRGSGKYTWLGKEEVHVGECVLCMRSVLGVLDGGRASSGLTNNLGGGGHSGFTLKFFFTLQSKSATYSVLLLAQNQVVLG